MSETVSGPPVVVFIVLRMQSARATSPLMRSYSLSGGRYAARYRVSVKCEAGAVAGAYLDRQVNPGDCST
jgi:ferredoxin-NADP reductase